jgi:hypothetical protein
MSDSPSPPEEPTAESPLGIPVSGTSIKVHQAGNLVMLSMNKPTSTIFISPLDAMHLAILILEKAYQISKEKSRE